MVQYLKFNLVYYPRFSDAGWQGVRDHEDAYSPSSEESHHFEAVEEPGAAETLQAGRDRIESKLRQPIFVKKYPGRAGEVLEREADLGRYGSGGYTNGENMYAPFAHRLDWEIARWCKLRGPGSNAVTELLGIEGVCTIKFLDKYSHLEIGSGSFEIVVQEYQRIEATYRPPVA